VDPEVHVSGRPLQVVEQRRDQPRRAGERWDDGTGEASLATETSEEGLSVDGLLVLPARIRPDETWDGGEVVDIGPLDVWYGGFEQAVSVSLSGGRLAGEAGFARELGPVKLSLDGDPWELAGYQWLETP
jgi:hypothetical protein